jgi:hypothetical protein
VVRFEGLCVFVLLVGLKYIGVSWFIRSDGVACVSKYFDIVFMAPDSL